MKTHKYMYIYIYKYTNTFIHIYKKLRRTSTWFVNYHGNMLLKAKDLYLGIPSHRQDQTRFCRATIPHTRDGPKCNHGRTYCPALLAQAARLRVCSELRAHAIAIQTPSLMIFVVITVFLWRSLLRTSCHFVS